ncbi:probable auxin efflux carrier component 8 [Phalaenopsis equestris]|uniref:probable auxin efflux carrier component 8 n=1 Tax=Phalaenopsis equestris TaxID=78828 RepID=UPI0009E5A71D|nr:probable auxin efflux carrier component 8 [Phalaenopsis equestris]
MISWEDVYHVLEATVPLYVAMALAYLSVRWWKLFTPDQCSVINKFVAKISIPLLSYHVISTNNPYHMNLKLLLADIVQKFLALIIFAILSKVYIKGSIDLLITGFSVSTLPNTLIVGIPLLKGLYDDEAAQLLGQIVVLQSLLWYTLLLFLFEFRAAKELSSPASENSVHMTDNHFAHEVAIEEDEMETRERIHSRTEEKKSIIIKFRNKSWLILSMVGRKLISNPNTYACLVGLLWSLISNRWAIVLPTIIKNSISILANGGLGMAMFSLGLFMASQSRIIACGLRMLIFSMVLRFIVGPILMAIPSYTLQMKGTLLNVAIIQASLPQGIVPFVFAKDYDVCPDILSAGVIVGMFLAIPVTLVYSLIIDRD